MKNYFCISLPRSITFVIFFTLLISLKCDYIKADYLYEELKEDYGLLGGVIEFGNSIYFVKAVGNNDLVKSNKSNFNEFVYSISLK